MGRARNCVGPSLVTGGSITFGGLVGWIRPGVTIRSRLKNMVGSP
jgi:hypothetical protein